jgi:thiamine-phosphate pyrophosphorylase
MKVIILSPQKQVEDEIDKVIALFEEGLNIFHLRKPHYSTAKLRSYLDKIPHEFHNRIVIHSHHKLALKYNLKGIHLTSKHRKTNFRNWLRLKGIKRKNPWITVSTSFQSISELELYNDLYDYVFLSPIFDSLSGQDYQSGFKEFSLSSATKRSNYKIVALGGVELDKLEKASDLGFWACGFLGTIWNHENSIEKFKMIKNKAQEIRQKNQDQST